MPSRVPASSKLTILRASLLEGLPWLTHGFSTRRGGCSQVYGGCALNLGFTRDDARSAVVRNRHAFLAALGNACGRPWALVRLRQIHSDLIHRVEAESGPLRVGDGLLTATPRRLLAVLTADCLPVILVDPRRRAVGVFHAGWRGTVKRIVEKGAGLMGYWFGSSARDLWAAIGPGIHRCCYEVGEEVRERFESQFGYAARLFREVKDPDPAHIQYPRWFLSARPPGHSHPTVKLFLDLVEANRRQLLDAGLVAKNIEVIPLCTCCRMDLLFSHRAEHGVTGRLIAVAGVRAGRGGET